jgi:hypothetical protein
MIYDDDFFEQEKIYYADFIEEEKTEERKPIRRRGRKKRSEEKEPKNKIYFGKETHNSIFEYVNSSDIEFKKELYLTKIFPSFEKLVENLINIHKFVSYDDPFEELKADCITFLFENMSKFDFNRGTNAFSYFNVLAKHWLIIRSKQRQQRAKFSISIDATNVSDNSSDDDNNLITPLITHVTENNKNKIETENEKKEMMDLLFIIKGMVKSKNELNCINSIISIFQNIENIDLLNKNAVFLYLREISGLNPKQLTLTIQVIKKYYRKAKNEQVKKYETFSR